MRRDDKRRIGVLRVRQRGDAGEGAVLRAQFLEFAVAQCTGGTRGHTGRVVALGEVVLAEVALGHDTLVGVVLRCTVGAGPFAVTAADALVLIERDDAILALLQRARRAGAHADGVLAVIAGDRRVVREHVLVHRAFALHPLATGVLRHSAEGDGRWQVVLVLAGDTATGAAGALVLIDVETELLSHDLVTPSLPVRARCASHRPWRLVTAASW